MNVRLEVGQSTVRGAGKGVFALEDIAKGEVIGEYAGLHLNRKTRLLPRERPYVYETVKRVCIVPLKKCELGYINDFIDLHASEEACERIDINGVSENARFSERKGRVYVVSTRLIRKGEELFINYGPTYWNPFFRRAKAKRLAKCVEECDGDFYSAIVQIRRINSL